MFVSVADALSEVPLEDRMFCKLHWKPLLPQCDSGSFFPPSPALQLDVWSLVRM